MSNKKERIDVLLVEQGFFETREKAKRAVMAGLVYIEEERCDKAGEKVPALSKFQIKGQVMPYVSRGGYKLEKAIKEFHVDVNDKVLLDIGSSTGGFTDCALQNGARMSYAVDVGYNQLAWKLRNDERVVVMERTNFRHCTKADFPVEPTLCSIDVSFISLRLILPVAKEVLASGATILALIKPQFEAGRELVGKKGIVRDRRVHEDVVEDMIQFTLALGLDVHDVTYSPITGGDGNIEFLMHATKPTEPKEKGELLLRETVQQIVAQAHEELKK